MPRSSVSSPCSRAGIGELILDSIKGCGVACSVLEPWFSRKKFPDKISGGKEKLMKRQIVLLAAMAALGIVSGDRGQSIGAESAQADPATSFFVSSTGSK